MRSRNVEGSASSADFVVTISNQMTPVVAIA